MSLFGDRVDLKSGLCYLEFGVGDACDISENACPAGMSCGKEGLEIRESFRDKLSFYRVRCDM